MTEALWVFLALVFGAFFGGFVVSRADTHLIDDLQDVDVKQRTKINELQGRTLKLEADNWALGCQLGEEIKAVENLQSKLSRKGCKHKVERVAK